MQATAPVTLAPEVGVPLGAWLELHHEGGRVSSRGQTSSHVGHTRPTVAEAPADRPGAGWSWDGTVLTAYTDWYGFQPLFYAVDGGRIVVGHSLLKLLAAGVDAALDYDALAVFMHLGWYLGEDTPFRQIKVLPPAGRLTWCAGSATVEGGMHLTAPNGLSFAQAVEGYAELFRAAVRTSLEGDVRICLPLSGGKDSRHILLALLELGRVPDECVTFHQLPWQEFNYDVPIAEELAREHGLPHVVLAQAGAGHELELQKNLATHLCSDEHTHYMVLRNHLAAAPGTVVYDGAAGDVLSESKVRDDSRLRLYRKRDFGKLADLELGGPGYRPRLLGPACGWYSWDAVRERVKEEIARYAQASNPFSAYRFWTRTRREIALSPLAILAGHPAHLPYLYGPLYELLSGLDGELLVGANRLHTATMAAAYGPPRVPFDYERKTSDLAGRYAGYRSFLRSRRQRDLLQSKRWLAASLAYAAKAAPAGLFNRRYLLGRGVRALLARTADSGGILPWLPRMITYVTQVHRIAADPRAEVGSA